MADLLQTLSNLNGKRDTLAYAKGAVDAVVYEFANQQAMIAHDIALVVAQLQGSTAFGDYSSIDQILRAERFAGKDASIDFVKANPTCTMEDACAVWDAAATAATHLSAVIVDPARYAALYQANLFAAGLTPDASWDSQRAWMIATPKDIIMGG